MFSAFIPDMHYFKGLEGGRTLPFLHPDGVANLAPKLQTVMQAELGAPVTSEDFLAYVACIASHRGYTETFPRRIEHTQYAYPNNSRYQFVDSCSRTRR